ncbi:unnamed protein product [Cylicocyclus nassatus]|uniref:Aminoacyl-tRNA synthetase class II (D/K/N) domain-containing protein n=1 Tax=Cylicocyclus nassatus TaxID=53992 RepID=A0AA36GW13_CYLNA|nr:unnamed protein product [Cylicocyclus nassatus]
MLASPQVRCYTFYALNFSSYTSAVHVGNAVSINKWQPSLGEQQERELLASSCKVVANDVEPRYSSLSPDQLRKKVHLRSRSSAFAALLRLRSKLLTKIHEYFMKRGYVHIDTPVITANDCEGAGETFSIAEPTSGEEFFAKKDAFLSVSGQLHLEAMVRVVISFWRWRISLKLLFLTRAALFTSIAETVGDFHGDRGFAWVRAGLVVKVIDGDIALVRVESSSEKFVTSRSIRACDKFVIKYRRKELYGLLRTAETGVEKNAILKVVNSVTGKLE